jgi:hypothetical protein
VGKNWDSLVILLVSSLLIYRTGQDRTGQDVLEKLDEKVASSFEGSIGFSEEVDDNGGE